MMHPIIDARKQHGFLSTDELMASFGGTNQILDTSVLISQGVRIGSNNIFYPNVVVECSHQEGITIGDNNIFYPGTYILSSDGTVTIGNSNEFGPSGCTIKANTPETAVTIGDEGRYTDGANIMGDTTLGTGSQVLGNVIVQSCVLAAGGTHRTPNPDERAAVLKGFGLARGLVLEKGQVVNGCGNFADCPVEWQRDYHAKASSE